MSGFSRRVENDMLNPILKRAAVATALLFALASAAAAQSQVFIVRHAEKAVVPSGAAPMMAEDPNLSAAGEERAASLAAALRDAAITAIYATQYKRTQQTAAPVAKALGLTVNIIPSGDLPGLLEKVKAASGNVLVVGHSNSVTEIVAGLGVPTTIKVTEPDYDNLFIVTRGARPTMLRLHYR